MAKKIPGIAIYLLAVLFLADILAWAAVFELSSRPPLRINFFNMGKRYAIFIQTSQGENLLVDGGGGDLILKKLAEKMPFWQRTINLAVLTSPKENRLPGLNEVLKRYRVKNILWTGLVRERADYREWKKLIRKEGAEIFIARAGQKIIMPGRIAAHIEIIYPLESLEGRAFREGRDGSVIMRMVFGRESFLLTGGKKDLLDILKEYAIKNLKTGKKGDAEVVSDGEGIGISLK